MFAIGDTVIDVSETAVEGERFKVEAVGEYVVTIRSLNDGGIQAGVPMEVLEIYEVTDEA